MPPMLTDYTAVTADTVRAVTDESLERADGLVADAIRSAASPTFETTLLPLERAGAELVASYGRGAFMGQVHPDPAVRDAGTDAEERINKWRVAVVFPRRNVQEAMRVREGGSEPVVIGGRAVAATRLVLQEAGGAERQIWVDAEQRVLKVAIPSRDLVAVRDAPPR